MKELKEILSKGIFPYKLEKYTIPELTKRLIKENYKKDCVLAYKISKKGLVSARIYLYTTGIYFCIRICQDIKLIYSVKCSEVLEIIDDIKEGDFIINDEVYNQLIKKIIIKELK